MVLFNCKISLSMDIPWRKRLQSKWHGRGLVSVGVTFSVRLSKRIIHKINNSWASCIFNHATIQAGR